MLRIPAVIAVLGLSVLTLAACSSGPASASCERTDSDASVWGLVETSGEFGAPEMTVSAPVFVDSTAYTDETVGEGLRVTSDDQDVEFSVAIVRGSTGEQILSSGTQVQQLAKWRTGFDGLAQLMMCATEGTRVVGAVPADQLSPEAAKSLGLADDESIVVTLDLTKVYLGAADGTPQYNDRRGMPSVVLAPDGRPGVIIPDAQAPSELAVETLKKGTGATITETDAVRVHVTSVDWTTRQVVASTWEDGASQVVKSADGGPFSAELAGATVGSQLLIVAPPAGAGEAATVYVVDILGIDDPVAAAQ